MTRTVTLFGARGGSGASTVAAALALHAAEDLPTALSSRYLISEGAPTLVPGRRR